MTPMEKVKEDFKKLTDLIENKFSVVNLNKASAKTHVNHWDRGEIHEKKPVKSDFIKVFKSTNNPKENYSFGFHFTYLNREEAEQSIFFSLKNGATDKHFISKPMNILELRQSIRELNQKIEELPEKTYQNLVELFSDQYIPEKKQNIGLDRQRTYKKKKIKI